MKQAIIIYNEGAGFGNNVLNEVEEALKKEGYSTRACSKKAKEMSQVLQQKADLVVVSGGDGTVNSVVYELAGSEVPIYIWPTGSSNNIATSFGNTQNISTLKKGNLHKLNIGNLLQKGQEVRFLESAGVGLISQMMDKMMKEVNYGSPEEKINKSIEVLLTLLKEGKEQERQLYLDDELYHDQYLAVEIMNTPYAGPKLLLAPEADPGDGFFEVVLITRKQADELTKYLENRLSGQNSPPELPVFKARNIRIVGKGLHFHADDDTFRSHGQEELQVSFEENSVVMYMVEQ